jgi:hypothetical protein
MIQTRKPNKSNAVDPLGTMFLSRYLVPSSVPVPCITHCFSPSPSPHHNHIHADLVSPRLLTFIVPMSDTYIHPVCRKKVTGVPCAPFLPWRWRCGGEEPNNDFPLLRNASNASGIGEIYIWLDSGTSDPIFSYFEYHYLHPIHYPVYHHHQIPRWFSQLIILNTRLGLRSNFQTRSQL